MKVFLTVAVLMTAILSQGAFAKKRECEAQFSVNNGQNYSAFIDLGTVGGNKKKNCFEKAGLGSPGLLLSNLKKAGVTFPAVTEAMCEGKSGLEVRIVIDVEGKRNDGVEKQKIFAKCTYKNGNCIKWEQVVNGAQW